MITLYFDKFDEMNAWLEKHYVGNEAFVNHKRGGLTVSFFLGDYIFLLRCLEKYSNQMLEQLPFETIYWGEIEER